MGDAPADAPLRVLGIDPGLTRCGVGVVDGPPADPTLIGTEVLRTSADTPLPERLAAVYDGLAELIAAHRPGAVAVERVLFSGNARTAMATGQSAGIALLAAAHAGVAVATHTPTEVKLAVAGHGAAGKDAVGRMVAAQLGLDGPPGPADAADAVAVALCHLAGARLGDPDRDGSGGDRGRAGDGGWEAAIAGNPHVRPVGGTS